MTFATRCLLPIFAALAGCTTLPATDAAKAEVAAAGQAWTAAVNACELDKVQQLYHPEAVLWGTTSATIATSPASIRQYFERSCASGSNAKIVYAEQNIRAYGDTALNSGTYNVSLLLAGQPRVLPARYSFVYRRVGGQWLIFDHHSSLVPTPPQPPQPPPQRP